MARRPLYRTILFVALLSPLPALAQDAPAPSYDEIVERILALKGEIDELMALLPPELREDVAEKLAESASEPETVPEPEAAAEPETEADQDAANAPAATPPPPRRSSRRVRSTCNTLQAFDTNGDGKVDALDRYWRYLYLWIDRNRDGRLDEREIFSTFRRKVEEIATGLESFESVKSGFGEIRIGEHVVLDLGGDGFAEGSRDDAVLLVDATALKRGDGPRLTSSTGEPIEGIRPFERGWRLEDASGDVIRLDCP